jgi:signal transduction histidine kinase
MGSRFIAWIERNPFGALQLAFWLVVFGLALLPALGADLRWDVVRWLVPWAAVGVALTSGVSRLLRRLPDAAFRGRLLVAVLPGALVGSLAWVALLVALEPLVGVEPLLGPRPPPEGMYVLGFLRGTFLLSVWGALALALMFSRRVQQERERSREARALADRAQLELLRSQLNPHFLFNALNSVVGLVAENPRGAQAMVRDLSTLLRRALDSSRSVATLGEELDFVRLYLKVERVRFEERLQVHFELEAGLEVLLVPAMVLQPLVENAVKHGRSSDGARVELTVRAKKVDGVLRLEVVNPGTLSTRAPPLDGAGLGVRSVGERVARLVPDVGRFTLTEAEGLVVARVDLPEGGVPP